MNEKLHNEGESQENLKPEATVEKMNWPISEEDLRQIFEIEKESFPEQMQSSMEDIKEVFENTDGIHLFVKDREGKISGYLSGLKQSDEYEYLSEADPKFTKDDEALYIESIAIKPEKRKLSTSALLLQKLKEEAADKGFKKITMHARVENKLSDVLQKRAGAKFMRRIENWYGFEEPFDFLELDLSEEEK